MINAILKQKIDLYEAGLQTGLKGIASDTEIDGMSDTWQSGYSDGVQIKKWKADMEIKEYHTERNLVVYEITYPVINGNNWYIFMPQVGKPFLQFSEYDPLPIRMEFDSRNLKDVIIEVMVEYFDQVNNEPEVLS